MVTDDLVLRFPQCVVVLTRLNDTPSSPQSAAGSTSLPVHPKTLPISPSITSLLCLFVPVSPVFLSTLTELLNFAALLAK